MVAENAAIYAENWQKWWDFLNPAWRERRDGRLVIGGTGDWSSVSKCGANGFLTVLESLHGLQPCVDEEIWAAALRDVRWVLEQILAFKKDRG